MSFSDARSEVRDRFVEVLQLLNFIETVSSNQFTPSTRPEQAQRGLLLVAIYSAVERGVNAYVDEALGELTAHAANVRECNPAIQSLFHYSTIQSLRDCASEKVLIKSREFIGDLKLNSKFKTLSNPISSRMQNVDGRTMEECCDIFGISGYNIENSVKARLNNLRERRNAVSHGRESAAIAGGRFSLTDLRRMLEVSDAEIERFGMTLEAFFESRQYLLDDSAYGSCRG